MRKVKIWWMGLTAVAVCLFIFYGCFIAPPGEHEFENTFLFAFFIGLLVIVIPSMLLYGITALLILLIEQIYNSKTIKNNTPPFLD
jgi:magnesium-transporting ATPase (P-type)